MTEGEVTDHDPDPMAEFWERACALVCDGRGINRAELDRGLATGRWHLRIHWQGLDRRWSTELLDFTVSLEDGPSPGLQ